MGNGKQLRKKHTTAFLKMYMDTYGEDNRILSGDENASRAPRTFEEIELKNAIVGI